MQAKASVFPEGPRGHWLLGCLQEKWREPAQFFGANRDRFGEIASFRLGPVRVFQLSAPMLIKQHFHTKAQVCIRGRGFEKLHPVLGDGLFTAEGRDWNIGRKQLQPFFATNRIESIEPMIREVGREVCEAISTNEVLDAKQLAVSAALQVVFKTLLGIPWDRKYHQINELTEIIKTTAHQQIHGIISRFQLLPTSNNRNFWSATRELRTLSEEIVRIGDRDAQSGSALRVLIDEFKLGNISLKFLIDQVTTLIVTGHETVANTLGWGLELLAIHSAARQKFAEAAANPNNSQSGVVIENTVKEIIRLYPAAWMISHEVAQSHTIGGWTIPRRALVFVVPYTVHRDPRLWRDPETFNPDRFIKADVSYPIDPYQFIPFGGGARFCIGRSLAETEIRILLEEITKRFTFHSQAMKPTEPEFSMTLRPKHSINLTFIGLNTNQFER